MVHPRHSAPLFLGIHGVTKPGHRLEDRFAAIDQAYLQSHGITSGCHAEIDAGPREMWGGWRERHDLSAETGGFR